MKNIPNANNALLNYIDALLMDGVPVEGDAGAESLTPISPGSNDNVKKDVPEDSLNPQQLRLRLFKVADIPLAMSNSTIAEVVEVKRSWLTRVMSKEGIVLWQLKLHGRNIHVLNAREIILPDGHARRQTDGDREKLHMLILKDGAFGLLCDDVGDCIDIDRQDVEWRDQRSTRQWLSGIVTGYNHAVLDENEIIHICDQIINSVN
jgi:purine-binding chemotaxis protein CheW